MSINPWNYKPWWCQPWSILLTGVGAIGGSWLLWHRLWVTGMVALPLSAWMGFFLLVWPRLMQEVLANPDLSADLHSDLASKFHPESAAGLAEDTAENNDLTL